MNRKFNLLLIFIVLGLSAFGQKQPVTVFSSGTEGYASFRIPAIIRLPGKDLLAFAEGRVKNAGDFGHVNIVMKRSKDGGESWGPIMVVATNATLQAGNPAPVVDLSDPKYPKGRIFLFYNTGNVSEGQIRQGKGTREVLYVTSVDNGHSWARPVDITDQTSKILRPAVHPQWNHPEDWRSYANTPGHALQIQTGKYKGRIYIAANHSAGTPKSDFSDYVAHGFYTDDHGRSFHLSENSPIQGSNEATAAELSGGRVMMNTRNQKGDERARIVTISGDGGHRWDTAYFDHQLPDPICEGSLLTIKRRKKGNVLAFCNNDSRENRDSLTLRISFDDGQSWKRSYLVEPKDTGYSDIVDVTHEEVGVLYESEGYKKIKFKTIKW